ncbi:MAG: malto-oligosyltrehalose synthase [Nitrospiraceae bacterium]
MAKIPVSTYRLQFNRAFRFKDAAEVTGYLSDLGITDVYCSPYLASVPGSAHGYDIVDPGRLNPELGSEEEFGHFVRALQERGMGQIMDVVANHMGINSEINRWWQDVLENGPGSPFAAYFDIDWTPLKPELQDKVLLPILGAPYGRVLEAKELQLQYDEGRIVLAYYSHRFPIAPETCSLLLTNGLDAFLQQEGTEAPHVVELQSILTALTHLPSRHITQPDAVTERYREKTVIRRRLATLVETHAAVRAYVAASLERANGTVGVPSSFDLLHRLLEAQAYRLAHWRVAAEEVNYRRFFDVNELAALRMELPAVFERSHRLIFDLLQSGTVTGLRIDHVDGLYDPADYLQRLQDWAASALAPGSGPWPLYLVVEKILGTNEELPAPWPVYGTTGYEFLSLINGLFVDRNNERAMDQAYARFVGEEQPFDELAYACKRLIMKVSMVSELNVLGHQLNRLSERDRGSRDFTLNSLIDVLREIIACFPVYRTYIRPGEDGLLDRDRTFIWQAVAKAKRRNPAVSGLVFDFVRDLLLTPITADGAGGDEHRAFVMKFQQLTSPVTAKGVEDTAFYRYHRLLSLNEVGGDPQQFGLFPRSCINNSKRARAKLHTRSQPPPRTTPSAGRISGPG